MTTVAVSILNHNKAQSTIACVRSLMEAEAITDGKCVLEIYLADNASDADDLLQLQAFLAKTAAVRFQSNQENLGFSAGHNRNLGRIFKDNDPDYVWVLNNDCVVAETALNALVEGAQANPDVGIWGATLLEADGTTIQCAGGCFYNAWVSSYRQFGHGKGLAELDQLAPSKFDYIAGASLFFPMATLKNGLRPVPAPTNSSVTGQQHWFNERYFLYFEELDLAKRLRPELEMAWCKEALIVHAASSSAGKNEQKRRALAEYHSTRSALEFTKLYYPHRLWVMAPIRYLVKCVLVLVKGRYRLIEPLTRAYCDFWRG